MMKGLIPILALVAAILLIFFIGKMQVAPAGALADLPAPGGIMINYVNANIQAESDSSQRIVVQVQNYGTIRNAVNLEAGIYADKVVNSVFGIPTASIIGGQEKNCLSEVYAAKKTVTLDAGEKADIEFIVKAPNPSSTLNMDIGGFKTGGFTSNWDTSHTVLAGVYLECGKGYTNLQGERGGLYSHYPCNSPTKTCGAWAARDMKIDAAAATPAPGETCKQPKDKLTCEARCNGEWKAPGWFESGTAFCKLPTIGAVVQDKIISAGIMAGILAVALFGISFLFPPLKMFLSPRNIIILFGIAFVVLVIG